MPDVTASQPARAEADVLEFARAARAAARAVGFYPSTHPAAQGALQLLVDLTRRVAARGPLCLTVLPTALLADGAALQSTDPVIADLAGMFHKHGIGALSVSRQADADGWRALLGLLARRPEDIRAAGGIERLWRASGNTSPGILEIDFGELLRGRVGGDVTELAGVIGYYLEGGVVPSLADAAVRALSEALETPDGVEAILRVLRSVARLAGLTEPQRLDTALRQAATLAGRFSEEMMVGLVARRGTPEAQVGSVDVVAAFVDRIPDTAFAQFVATAIMAAGGASRRLAGLFAALVPDPERRKSILVTAQVVAEQGLRLEDDFLEQWDQLELTLEAHSDQQYLSEDYTEEIQSARTRALGPAPVEDPPELIAAWLASIDEAAVYEQDLRLLTDLLLLETDPFRWRELLETLNTRILNAAEAGDWRTASVLGEAVARDAGETGDLLRRPFAAEALQRLSRSMVAERAMARLRGPADEALADAMALLRALGPDLAPQLVRRWDSEEEPARTRLVAVVAAHGQQSRDALRQLLRVEHWQTRRAALALLERLGGTEHVPALEPLLTDPKADVRQSALEALASSGSERALEILSRGIARAPDEIRSELMALLVGLGPETSVPILGQVLDQLAQLSAPTASQLQAIAALGEAGTDDAVGALSRVLARRSWRALYRRRRLRIAAITALAGIGSAPAREALAEASRTGGLSTRLLVRRAGTS